MDEVRAGCRDDYALDLRAPWPTVMEPSDLFKKRVSDSTAIAMTRVVFDRIDVFLTAPQHLPKLMQMALYHAQRSH